MESRSKRSLRVSEAVREFHNKEHKDVQDYVRLFIVANKSLRQGIALSWPELEEAIKIGLQ